LGNNQFLYGSIPESFCNLTTLTTLNLNSNSLTGSIPSCLFNLFNSSLNSLTLQDNYFSGPFPQVISDLPNRMSVNLSCNIFSPPFPEWCSATVCSICDSKSTCGNDVVENNEQCDPPGGCCTPSCLYANLSSCETDGVLCDYSICVTGVCVCGSCGDNICEVQENCVTCSQDCPSPCGLCGDGSCNSASGENCTTCYTDCGWCPASTCKNNCSGHGFCDAGTCTCFEEYTGILCEADKQPIWVTPGKSLPQVNCSTIDNQTVVQISIQEIFEIDTSGNTVQQIELSTLNFSLQIFNDSDFQSWQYTSPIFLGSSQLIVQIYLFNSLSTVGFGNLNFSYSADSLKYALQILNWPFKSAQNRLVIVFPSPNENNAEQNGCDSASSASQYEAGNFLYYQINLKSFSLLMKFINFAILDNHQKYVDFNLTNNAIQIIIPHFFQTALLDPDYSMLLAISGSDDNPCSSSNGNQWLIPVVSVMVVVFLASAVLVYFYVKRKRSSKLSKDKLQKVLSDKSVMMKVRL